MGGFGLTINDINIFAEENGLEITILDNPSYESAIVGLSSNYEVIYDYDLMIEYLIKDGMSLDDAIDFIEYNTMRAIPYVHSRNKPIILCIKDFTF